ncbi:MAG: sigma 54-interacting transcriptional regulator [Firmicutes bacterium]|nr:sigma 54-interacting transcriptional regulator [Bacillota bacterium]
MIRSMEQLSIRLKEILPILETITDAVFIDNNEGICLWCNTACEELYDLEIDEIEGRTVDELEREGIFSPSVTKRVLQENRELTIIHENRQGLRLLTTGTPIFDDQGILQLIITTSRDISGFTMKKHAGEELSLVDVRSLDASSLSSPDTPELGEHDIVAYSAPMKNVIALARRLAAVNTTVLITGESGVGKGLLARTLHEEGTRWKQPFVTVNCGAIPENLIESELFGYVAGAFTGSRSGGKRGYFEAAQNGTIFLDEISELPLNLQVKLLQVIQERQITPVGAVDPIPVDVRIISATNRNLADLVQEGRFREDLYYRLNVVPIEVPALRERTEDIIPLIRLNLAKYNQKLGEHKSISSDALSILLKYPWPGNIRELQNIVERLVITTSSDVITEDDIFIFIKEAAEQNTSPAIDTSLTAALEKAEREILRQTLDRYGSTRAIARVLRISQPTVVRKLQKYGLHK